MVGPSSGRELILVALLAPDRHGRGGRGERLCSRLAAGAVEALTAGLPADDDELDDDAAVAAGAGDTCWSSTRPGPAAAGRR